MITYDAIFQFNIGGKMVFFGKLAKPEASALQVYAAAFTVQDLHRAKCGFGGIEAEAAADLFRLARDTE
jgi:hypothetical protein